ncbi:ZIP family zinc transporter [Legionella lansingensis]|uniref:Integral membrane protein n=1 Tax=Legionella lansingensis TaxID=45067 RepID=A0A0W0VNN0_9GAMM|nr:membrane protein [Legionella lansingensis]KTD21533.1 integral membrane protein [Legionella lansingensis]SNV52533.1 ZIP family zinc transporter [Legionella lansingensis]
MPVSLFNIGLYSLLATLSMIVGGFAATIYRPSDKLTSAAQHFASGVVLAAVAKELIPKLGANQPLPALIIGFCFGIFSMLVLKLFANKLTEKETEQTGVSPGLVTTVGIDLFIDGVLIGIAFLAGTQSGLLIAIALALEILFLGVSTTAALGNRAVSIKLRLLIIILLALLIPLGSITGAGLLSQLPPAVTEGLLAFGVAALLYLVTEELLVEAHEGSIETPFITASFFIGFLCILLLENMTA